MRSYFLLVASGLLLAATGCTSHSPDDVPAPSPAQVYYNQTQCADKWGQASTTALLVSKATAYLSQQGVQLNQASATNTGQAAVCSACTCPTGLVLRGTVSQADLPQVLALGFRQ